MSLSIGIVGLPNVGKSTLFRALTNKQVDIQNYPFTTIDPNIGVVEVPDQRVDALALMSDSKKKIYATVDFTDIAGLVKGAAQGEGLGNKFLANIREVDMIAEVVRVFDDKSINHVHSRVSPEEDIGIINTELILADLETVTKRLEKTSPNDPKSKDTHPTLIKLKEGLESGKLASHISVTEKEQPLLKELNLLTNKKFIYVFNISEEQLRTGWQPDDKLLMSLSLSAEPGAETQWVTLCNTFELLLSEATKEEQEMYLSDMNLKKGGLDDLIGRSYSALGLLTFLTTGEDETRAWTAHIGDPIPRASRAIHTDFEKLFIRAEVINWKFLIESGSYANARSKGLIRTVGRDYIIQEGDVVEILIGK